MNSTDEKAMIASAALEFVPPLICNTLLDDKNFCEEYGIKTETMISFGSSGITVRRSQFFDAARRFFAGNDQSEIKDVNGRIWIVIKDLSDGDSPNLILASDQQRILLPYFFVLSNDPVFRIRYLRKSAYDVCLPYHVQQNWIRILEERPLEDHEVEIFQSDLRNTPVNVGRNISDEIAAGEGDISSIVPKSREYFHRLVGAYDGSKNVRDYAAGAGRDFMRGLMTANPYEGFLFSLLLSSHLSLTSEVDTSYLDKNEILRAFEYLATNGDTLSRIGAVEIGLRILKVCPEVEPLVLSFVRSVRDEDPQGEKSEFKLLSALFILVDGELARTRLLESCPAFYRRLASLAQASLVHREILKCKVDFDPLIKWGIANRGVNFYMQTLADMRLEPRWNPEFVSSTQLHADFIGRAMIAGNSFAENIANSELQEIVIGAGEESLVARCEFPRPYFPGPLEGAENSLSQIPRDIAQIIEEKLDNAKLEAASFFALVNSATIFNVESGYAELAAKALRLGRYRLENLEDKSQLVAILNGLATVAAVSRNLALADELRILVRCYRYDSQFGFSAQEAMQIALTASAAHEGLREWREFAGSWITELSFGELDGNEGAILHSHLLALLESVPELWVTCSRADAALRARIPR